MGLGQGKLDTETRNTSFNAAGPLEEEGTYVCGATKAIGHTEKGGIVFLREKGSGSGLINWSGAILRHTGPPVANP